MTRNFTGIAAAFPIFCGSGAFLMLQLHRPADFLSGFY
jgi:hypothetical protein